MMKRTLRSVIACVCALLLVFVPTANADMRGVDVSNWQCDIDTGVLDADFVMAGATWGVGGFSNSCLVNGVNQAANYQLGRASDTGKSIGVYHYAMGNSATAEADFFVDNVAGYIGRAVLALDWEGEDNPQFGNGAWIDSWVRRVYERTRVWPVIYVQASALGQLSAYVREHCGVWVAQYASNAATGWQSRPWNYGVYGEAMRQYTSSGYISGYAGRLDLNYFRGEAWQWDSYARGERGGGVDRPVGGETVADRPVGGTSVRQCVLVASGDSLSGIAARTGLYPWTMWTGYRSGDPGLIYPGETVCYGGSASVSESSARVHTVVPGESLWSIFGADWNRVAVLNGLANPSLIYPGQVLRY
jgi:GH25 family lysozyme M1 (1,4-beta-N-acetylmuramidase)|nr:MAG TPA: LysA like endolysin [Bacteriophage sp.]